MNATKKNTNQLSSTFSEEQEIKEKMLCNYAYCRPSRL